MGVCFSFLRHYGLDKLAEAFGLWLFFFDLWLSTGFYYLFHRQLIVVLGIPLVILGLIGQILVVLLLLPLHQELKEDLFELVDLVLAEQPF